MELCFFYLHISKTIRTSLKKDNVILISHSFYKYVKV
jgi:hypothetical protein